MSDIKSEILFNNAGLNFDDSPEFMPSHDSRYNLNILIGEDGANGVITNMLGNSRTVDISDHELILSHTYQVVGSYYNRLTRKVYYFVFSQPHQITNTSTTTTTGTSTTTDDGTGFVIDYTSGDFLYDNRLLCYNEDEQTLDLIFIDTKNYWGINPAYPMRDVTMIGNWLYFNPGVSEPKVIDVDMAYNYTNYDAYDATSTYIYGDFVTYFGGLFRANTGVAINETPVIASTKWDRVGNSYQNETDLTAVFDSEFYYAFNVLKHPPIYRPICTYQTDEDKNANNVRGKLFKITHRYKYFDNSYSVWGALSDVTLPIYDEYYNGEVTGSLDLYNYIRVDISLHSAALIKEIEIAFKEVGEDVWKRAKIINRQDIELLNETQYSYSFYNTDGAYQILDSLEVAKIEDAVPPLANAQEIINKNILAYGGVTEGFPNIDKNLIEVTLTPEIEAITIAESSQTVRRDNIANSDWVVSYSGGYWQILMDLSGWYAGSGITTGDVFAFTLNGKNITYTIQAGDTFNLATFVGVIGNEIKTNFPLLHNVGWGTTSIYVINDLINLGASIFYEPSGVSEVALTKKRGFKTGAWHPFCIFYYDGAMRRWEAQTSKDNPDGTGYTSEGTTVYVPMLNEYSPLLATTAYKWNINWTINHLPPSGAKWWRWGYAGNALCSYMVQYIISSITDDAPWTVMDIAPLQLLKEPTEGTWNPFPQSAIEQYQWVKGDRVRIITEASAANNMGVLLDGAYDYEIVKYDDTTTPGQYLIYVQDFDYAVLGVGEDSLIEIYRPIKTDTLTVFHEFGDIMPIIEESANVFVHGAGSTGTQNQVYATDTPATGVFDAGDVYHILRTPSKPIDTIEGYFHESMWYSDFYISDDWDSGKIGVETSFGRRYLNIIRYSRPYFQNTLINGLPTFDPNRYKELNDVYGDIVAIYEIGDTLKVYQVRKASSVGIGRSEYMDAEGKITVTGSDQILGIVRYSPSNYATIFPESISRNNKFIYGFDVYNGVMWRDSVNGIFPISGRYSEAGMEADYKMATYFKDKSKALLTSGIEHVDVLTVWDEEFKLLYVIFKDYVLEENNEVVVFHEPSNRWITFASFEQTPANGYNVMLELSYDIVKGFEGGLGYWFDEETRFAVFDIITTANVGTDVGADEAVLTLTAYPPTSVTCSAELEPANVDITLTAYPPTDVHISWVYTEDIGGNMITALSWDGDESDIGVAETVVIDTSETYVMMTAKPDWLTVRDGLTVINIDDHIDNATSLSVFPTLNNPGDTRTGDLSFQDVYGNERTITVSQGIDTGAYVKMVYIHPLEPTAMTFTYDADNTIATSGTTNVQLDITPNHPSYVMFESFDLYWEIQKKVGAVYTSIGTGVTSVYDEYPNVRSLTTTETLTDGMELYIFVSTVGFAT
jgi:hypothetical protein